MCNDLGKFFDQKKFCKHLWQTGVLPKELFAEITANIYVFEQIDSTSSFLKRLAAGGENSAIPPIALSVADFQTQGRGRGNNRWFSPPGSCGMWSLLISGKFLREFFEFECEEKFLALEKKGVAKSGEKSLSDFLGFLQMVPQATAFALLQTLEELYSVVLSFKWPNDVVTDSGKLAGVLVESSVGANSGNYCVLGCGVNLFRARQNAAPQAVFLSDLVSSAIIDLEVLLAEFLANLLKIFGQLNSGERSDFFSSLNAKNILTGKMVCFKAPPREEPKIIRGKFLEILPSGFAKILTDAGEVETFFDGFDVNLV